MATGLHIRNGVTLDKFTNQFSSSYALSYNPDTGQIGYMGTGSFTAGYLTLDNTGSFVTNAMTASMLSPYTLNSQTASFVRNTQTGSFLTTGSSGNGQTVSGSLTITENLTVLGTASIQYLNVIYETASVIYSSGSNQFGDATNDVQTLIGTVRVSGSQIITGSLDVSNIQYASSAKILAWDSTTGRISYMAGGDVVVFPYTGSAIMSGSAATGNTLNVIGTLAVTGSQLVTGSLGVTGSIYIGSRATNNLIYGSGYLNPGNSLIIEGPSGGPSSARILLHENTTDNSTGAAISFARSRAADNLDAGWRIGGLDFYRAWGRVGGLTAFEQSAYVRVISISGSTQTSVPSAMYFGTTPSGSITPQQRLVIQENGNVGVGAPTASATLHVSGANMIFDIPSKQIGYVLQSDASGNATWINPTTLTTANPVQMATGSVTASVNIGTPDIFKIVSGSSTLLSITGSTRHLSISGGIALHAGIPYASTFGGGLDGVIQTFTNPATYKTQMVFRPSGNIGGYATFWYSRLEQDGARFKMLSQYPTNVIGHIDNNGGTNVIGYKDGVSGNHGLVVTSNATSVVTTNYGSLLVTGSGITGDIFKINKNQDFFIVNSSGITTVSGSLVFSGSAGSLQFNLPSKASGYVLQSDTNGYASWVSPGSVAVFPYTGSALISGSLIVTGSINVNGSITGSLQGTASYASNSDLLDGKDSSTFATTGSNTYIGNQNVTGSLGINGSLTEYIVTSSLAAGVTTVFQRETGSYTSALAKYTVNKSTNARAGEFMAVWNGNEIVNADISTTDIGSTAEVAFSSSVVNGQIQTNIVTGTSGWTAKMLITYL
jgi:hypothetical protein